MSGTVAATPAAEQDEPEPRTSRLVDGSTTVVRPARAADRAALVELHRSVSDASIYMRFFSINRSFAETFAARVSEASPTEWSLVAERRGALVGVATACSDSPGTAEVALLVADEVHGLGIGTVLLEHLASWCRRRGVDVLTAEVLGQNGPMLRVFHDAGYRIEETHDHGVVDVRLDTSPTPESQAASDARWRTADRASLAPLFEPASVAVLGVSRRRGGVGREVVTNLLRGGYRGTVHALGHPNLHLDGVSVVGSLDELPEDLDLAVVALPAAQVEPAVEVLAARGTRTCVVLTSGLGEVSSEGRAAEDRLRHVVDTTGIRLIGPNCFGVISNLRGTRLDATFGQGTIGVGGLAIGSQSGGVGVALQQAVRARGDGLACFVSLGNKADVSGNDLLAAWAGDPDVEVAGLYLESFHDPVRFVRLAADFSRRKPLLVAYGGTSAAGVRAGKSHTAASATPSRALQAMFDAAGVIGVRSADELADTAALLVEQPLPPGRRVAVLSNAGGIGILAADAAARAGLELPDLTGHLGLAAAAPGAASTANPVDLGAAAGADTFASALDALVGSEEVDMVLVVVVATAVTDVAAVCASVERAAGSRSVPVATVVISDERPAARSTTRFRSAEVAVEALARVARYAQWRREGGRPAAVERERVARPGTGGWLTADAAAALVAGAGIRTPAQRVVAGADEAAEAAASLTSPMVVKAAVPELVHKTDTGAVRTGLASADEVAAAASSILDVLPAGSRLLLQEQVDGPEVAVGLTRDPRFGALLMLASGGVDLDLWADQVFLMPPVRESQVRAALRSLRTWPRLVGYRGSAPVDVDGLVALVRSVAQLAVERPDLAELDLNPVVCTATGPVAVDVKARLA
jgi:acyl-CoA synthetase (NDP forming)/GNAT superfamily N-acetyltransferase